LPGGLSLVIDRLLGDAGASAPPTARHGRTVSASSFRGAGRHPRLDGSVSVSHSADGGLTWSAPVAVSTIQTTVMPWVAARNGKVDVVYYGSTAASPNDPTAVWNVYDSQFSGGTWTVKQVSNTPNRVGAICLAGSGCPNNTNRELLDLFQVAEDPLTGKAAIIYTDSTIDTWTSNGVTNELPEIVLAFEQ
jgi:hypothetical protein